MEIRTVQEITEEGKIFMIVIIHCNKNNKIADYLNFKKKKTGKRRKGRAKASTWKFFTKKFQHQILY